MEVVGSGHFSVGIFGYGRFGHAFADLLSDAGLSVRAVDAAVTIPSHHHAGSAAELLTQSDTVVLAVPVHKIHSTLTALRPDLNGNHLVMDVASVKRGAVNAMSEILAQNVPWIATHPLFGPSSIALGERPLDVVICPNEQHPTATSRARQLYEHIGCRVSEQDADEHDRLMAKTHALAFFVAKGMIDIGAGEELASAPPSFRAMAKTIESTRSDAGHLFRAIQRDNPYSAEAREQLLGALTRVHNQLADTAPLEAPSAPLGIPDLAKPAPELRETRDLIDELDHELVRLLARRANLARRAGAIKAEQGRGVRDPARERELLAEREAWARRMDLDPSTVSVIFEAILSFSRHHQQTGSPSTQ